MSEQLSKIEAICGALAVLANAFFILASIVDGAIDFFNHLVRGVESARFAKTLALFTPAAPLLSFVWACLIGVIWSENAEHFLKNPQGQLTFSIMIGVFALVSAGAASARWMRPDWLRAGLPLLLAPVTLYMWGVWIAVEFQHMAH